MFRKIKNKNGRIRKYSMFFTACVDSVTIGWTWTVAAFYPSFLLSAHITVNCLLPSHSLTLLSIFSQILPNTKWVVTAARRINQTQNSALLMDQALAVAVVVKTLFNHHLPPLLLSLKHHLLPNHKDRRNQNPIFLRPRMRGRCRNPTPRFWANPLRI